VLYTWDLYSITYGVPMEPAEENQLPIKQKKEEKVDTAGLSEPNEKSLH